MTCLGKRKDGQPCNQRCVRYCRWHSTSDLCSICLEQPSEIVKLTCDHTFCKECIYNWIYNQDSFASCPMCRTPISKVIRLESIIWGVQQGVIERRNIFSYELEQDNYILFTLFAGPFVGKLLTQNQFDTVCSEIPGYIFDNVKITQKDLYIFTKKVPPQDFYCVY